MNATLNSMIRPAADGERCREVQITPDGRMVAALCQHELIVFEIDSAVERLIASGLASKDGGLVLSIDGSRVSLRRGGVVHIWDTATGKLLHKWPAFLTDRARMMPNGWSILDRHKEHRHGLDIFDAATGDHRTGLWEETRADDSITVSGDGSWIEATTLHWGDEPWVVWDAATGKIVSGNVPRPSKNGHFRRDWLVVPRGNEISVWDLPCRTRVFQQSLERRKCTAIAATPEANQITVGFDDGQIELWDWSAEPTIRRLAGHSAAVTALAVGPDAERMISASCSGEVQISEPSTLSVVKTFQFEPLITICLIRHIERQAIVIEKSGRIYRIGLGGQEH